VTVKTVEHLRLTGVYEPDENGWISARVLEIPGINTSGRTPEEAKELLVDAVREFVASVADEAAEKASDSTRFETVEIELY
jgi:predicted RNase H-like HicB family nuclease